MEIWLQRIAWLCLAIAFGLALVALQFSLGLPTSVMQSALAVLLGPGVVVACIVALRYYGAIAKDDD